MNLRRKKQLAANVLKVGKKRIHFASDKFSEIKEAITKQDIKDLYAEGFITIKPIKGRRKIVKRKTRRGPGKIKKKVNKRKQVYVKITRKLRRYLKELKTQSRISNELFLELRKKIRMRAFKSKANLKEYLERVEKIDLNQEIRLIKPKKEIKKKTETNKTQIKTKRKLISSKEQSENKKSSSRKSDTNKKTKEKKK